MNTIVEFEVKEVAAQQAAEQAPKAVITEIDLSDLGLVGGGLVSPCFA